jgi:putative Holliday junction resolvase
MTPTTAVLGLDVGTRRTGVAFLDPAIGFVLPLDTILHETDGDVVAQVKDIIAAKNIKHVVVGLPLLPSGAEGSQAKFSRSIGDKLVTTGVTVSYFDERYTTVRNDPGDGDARAACTLLTLYLANNPA